MAEPWFAALCRDLLESEAILVHVMRIAYFIGLCLVHAMWIARVLWEESTPSVRLIALPGATTLGAALVLARIRAGRIMFLLAGAIECAIFTLISVAGLLGAGLMTVGGHPDTLKALLSLGSTILVAVYLLVGLIFYGRTRVSDA